MEATHTPATAPRPGTRFGRLSGLLLAVLVLLGGAQLAPARAQEDPTSASLTGHSWLVQPAGPLGGADVRSYFVYELEPGDRVEDVLAVVNHSTVPLTLGVSGADAFTNTDDGSFGLTPTAAEPRAVGAWVRLAATQVTVPPRARVEVPFVLAVPDNATPGDHAGGIVTSFVSTITGEDGSEVLFDARIAVRVYLSVPGERRPVLTLDDLEVTYDPAPYGLTGTVTVGYLLANDGNVRLGLGEVVRVSGPFGIASRQTSSHVDEVLPGGSVLRRAVLAGVPRAGWLHVDVETAPVDLGAVAGEDLPSVVDGVRLWAVPWLWLAVVLLVVTALVVLVRARRRRWRALQEEVRLARGMAPEAEAEATDRALDQINR